MVQNVVNQPSGGGGDHHGGGWAIAIILLVVLGILIFVFGPGRRLIIREPEGTTTVETQ